MVAAIGEQILGPTDVSLSNWTVRPSGPRGALRQPDARPRAPLRLPVPSRHGLQLRNVYDPLYGSFAGDQGAWSTAKMYFTVPPNGVAKLHFGAHFQAPGLPNQTAGTVDVYGLQILDATLEAGNTEVELGNFLVRSNSQSSVALASFTGRLPAEEGGVQGCRGGCAAAAILVHL